MTCRGTLPLQPGGMPWPARANRAGVDGPAVGDPQRGSAGDEWRSSVDACLREAGASLRRRQAAVVIFKDSLSPGGPGLAGKGEDRADGPVRRLGVRASQGAPIKTRA